MQFKKSAVTRDPLSEPLSFSPCLCVSPQSGGPLPRGRGRPWQNGPLTLVHTSSARARPPRWARFWAQPSPRPASCPPCLDCPRVSSRSPLHARSALQGRPRGRALASTCMSWQLDAADAGCMRPTAHPAERVRRHAPWALHHSGSVRACPHQTSHPVLTHEAQDSRWLQDSGDCVAWAAHGMPESPDGVPRPSL